MDCQSIMHTPPTHLRQNATVDEAILCLLDNHMYAVPVTDDDDILVGEINVARLTCLLLPTSLSVERGLRRLRFVRETLSELRGRLDRVKNRPISEFIDRKVSFVYPDSPIIDALLLLRDGAIRVPVVEPGSRRLVGAISFLTVLRAVEGIESEAVAFEEEETTGRQRIDWTSTEGTAPPSRSRFGRFRKKQGGDDA